MTLNRLPNRSVVIVGAVVLLALSCSRDEEVFNVWMPADLAEILNPGYVEAIQKYDRIVMDNVPHDHHEMLAFGRTNLVFTRTNPVTELKEKVVRIAVPLKLLRGNLPSAEEMATPERHKNGSLVVVWGESGMDYSIKWSDLAKTFKSTKSMIKVLKRFDASGRRA